MIYLPDGSVYGEEKVELNNDYYVDEDDEYYDDSDDYEYNNADNASINTINIGEVIDFSKMDDELNRNCDLDGYADYYPGDTIDIRSELYGVDRMFDFNHDGELNTFERFVEMYALTDFYDTDDHSDWFFDP